MKPWKTLSRRTILDYSKFLVVEEHTIELPDGRIIDDWPWVITPDYVNVTAVTENGLFLYFRQTKYCVEGTSLAPVGGHIEPGEDARRVAEIDADDLEEHDLLLLSRVDVEAALDAGDFKSLPWAAAVALALRRLMRKPFDFERGT